MNQEIFRNLFCEENRVPCKQFCEILFEVCHKLPIRIGRKNALDIHLVFLQMIQNMAQLQLQIFAVQRIFLLGKQICEHMVKDVTAEALQ